MSDFEREPLPIKATGLMPHGPGVQIVDELTRIDGKTGWSRVTIRAGSIFVDGSGLLDEVAYIEMIAQSYAIWYAYETSPARRPELKGMLIGVKNLVIHDRAKVGDVLDIEVHKIIKFGDFGVIEGVICRQDGTKLAAGEVKIWGPDIQES